VVGVDVSVAVLVAVDAGGLVGADDVDVAVDGAGAVGVVAVTEGEMIVGGES
jgi:hypothetical protein